jgi:hypothetical protein
VRRLVLLAGLCLAAAVLVVGFGVWFNGSDAYPDPEAVDANYDAYVGETVHVWGEVTAVDDETFVVTSGPLALRVEGSLPPDIAPGDGVQVYGRLTSDRRVVSASHHAQSSEAIGRMYLVSVVGIALAAGAFLRRWRVDTHRWAFVPREGE